jgi:hypothetical protein
MSGRAAYLNKLADEIFREATDCSYHTETQDQILGVVYKLRLTATFVDRVDCLLSGEDDEAAFHEKLHEELQKVMGLS